MDLASWEGVLLLLIADSDCLHTNLSLRAVSKHVHNGCGAFISSKHVHNCCGAFISGGLRIHPVMHTIARRAQPDRVMDLLELPSYQQGARMMDIKPFSMMYSIWRSLFRSRFIQGCFRGYL